MRDIYSGGNMHKTEIQTLVNLWEFSILCTGLVGKTNLEQYYVDRIMDTVEELYIKAKTLYFVLADQKEERVNEFFFIAFPV